MAVLGIGVSAPLRWQISEVANCAWLPGCREVPGDWGGNAQYDKAAFVALLNEMRAAFIAEVRDSLITNNHDSNAHKLAQRSAWRILSQQPRRDSMRRLANAIGMTQCSHLAMRHFRFFQ